MSDSVRELCVYILAKNEARNIGRCLTALSRTGWSVVILDSGSTDETVSIVQRFAFAAVRAYRYSNHCAAYNEITVNLARESRYVLVLDADMIVGEALIDEIKQLVLLPIKFEAAEASILMCVDGLPLRYGSLYPPKACLFATGRAYFEATGHGERLVSGVRLQRFSASLTHDDRKDYTSYLLSQVRYARNLSERATTSQYTFRDWLRTKTPLLVLAVPFVSYVLKLGFTSGRAGVLYAMDRLIAEAVMYRQAVASALERDKAG